MKVWFGKFVDGMGVACRILIVIAVTTAVVTGLITALLWVVACVENITPTPGTIVTVICTCFVVVFGIIWSFWD